MQRVIALSALETRDDCYSEPQHELLQYVDLKKLKPCVKPGSQRGGRVRRPLTVAQHCAGRGAL